MNILISVNYKYLDKAKTMLYSLSLNCQEKLTVYLLNKELKQPAVNRFQKFLRKKCNAELFCLDVNHLPFDNMPILEQKHFSIEMYYRILAYDILSENISRILWLDADIVILNDIKNFYYQDFNEKCMVVTPDVKYNSDYISSIKSKIGLPKEHIYFNSGVILFNIDLIRKTYSAENVMDVCNLLKEKLSYPDQDILNYLYIDKVKYAGDFNNNYQLYEGMKYNKDEMKEVRILHYTGFEKPWDYKTINEFSKYYWNIQLKRYKYFSFLKCMILHKIRNTLIRLYQKYLLKIH